MKLGLEAEVSFLLCMKYACTTAFTKMYALGVDINLNFFLLQNE